MTRALKTAGQSGFTLVEAIISIVLIGLLSAVVAVFIRTPVQGYVDSVARAEVTDTADLALRRMARDLRLALPNSIRVSPDRHTVEFLLTTSGGRYLATEDVVDEISTPINQRKVLDFLAPPEAVPLPTEFSVVGAMPSLSSNVTLGDFVVVNNLGEGFDPADAYRYDPDPAHTPLTHQRNIARITGIALAGQNVETITLENNPFAGQATPTASPGHRFQVVSGPVSYHCGQLNGRRALTRHWNYNIQQNQPVPPPAGAAMALLADNLATCDDLFRYDTDNIDSTRRSGLVILTLSLRPSNANEGAVTLIHQVHVDNTP